MAMFKQSQSHSVGVTVKPQTGLTMTPTLQGGGETGKKKLKQQPHLIKLSIYLFRPSNKYKRDFYRCGINVSIVGLINI